jgi:cold shock CspA family protein
MSEQSRVAVCRRCGIEFLITPNYLDQIQRWGARVSVPQLCARCFRGKGPLPKRSGTFKWFDRRKRYGFIAGERGEEIFVHQNALYEANGSRPREGQAALYHVHYAIKGPEALNVELMDTGGPGSREPKER